MNANFTDQSVAIKAKTTAFGNYIDPDRKLADVPNMVLVEVDLPEYQRNGLGRALLKVVRYQFEDINKFGAEGLSVCADVSTGHMVYEDMNPVVVGTHSEAQEKAPKAVLEALYQRKFPIEFVTLGALRHQDFETIEKLIAFLEMYSRRASWMESRPSEVRFANMEASVGEPGVFDWNRIFPGLDLDVAN